MRQRELTLYFVLVFAWIWIIAGLVFGLPDIVTRIFGPMSQSNILFVLATWGPNIVAFLVTSALRGRAGSFDLVRRFAIWRVGLRWYLVALVAVPALGLGAALIAGTYSESPLGSPAPDLLNRLGPIIVNLLVTGSLGEELGWRGFVLPRMLQRWSPLASSLILGATWGLWHLPSFLAAGTPNSGTSLPAFLLGALSLSTIATWLFANARESVLLASMLHFGANFALTALRAPLEYYSPLLLLMCLIVVAARPSYWLRRPSGEKPGVGPGPAIQRIS